MKNSAKKAAVTVLVCVTAAGMMTGCGNKKLDGTKTSGVPRWVMILMRLTVRMQ